MIYPFSLQAVGITVGLLLIASHLVALLAPGVTGPFLRDLPRSRVAAGVLLAIGTIWTYWLVQTMDLGEFTPLRSKMLLAIPIGAVLTWLFVDEFLAIRALGIIALLAANPLLESAFLRPETTRLFLVVLAYAWIFAGLFMVGMPYIFRDLIRWIVASPARLRQAAVGGIAYGALIFASALFFWK